MLSPPSRRGVIDEPTSIYTGYEDDPKPAGIAKPTVAGPGIASSSQPEQAAKRQMDDF
jgi:hypothetical protein